MVHGSDWRGAAHTTHLTLLARDLVPVLVVRLSSPCQLVLRLLSMVVVAISLVRTDVVLVVQLVVGLLLLVELELLVNVVGAVGTLRGLSSTGIVLKNKIGRLKDRPPRPERITQDVTASSLPSC